MMAVLSNFIATREFVLWQVNCHFLIFALFLTKCPGKIWTKKLFSGLLLFLQHGKKYGDSLSLTEAYDFCSIPARLPIVFLYFQGFLVSLGLIYKRRRCKKTIQRQHKFTKRTFNGQSVKTESFVLTPEVYWTMKTVAHFEILRFT